MVFQKKGVAKARQTPKKNKVERNDDLDFESDQMVTKTPKTPDAKTPKGKQPQSEKRVSFQISGKNTPAKTPKNENSLVGKKQTPAKMSLKEFKGVKPPKNGNQKRKSFEQDDDEEEDDDDDDDDDLEMDEDEDDDMDEGEDDDMDEGEDDDMDEGEDDDMDEGEEEDDDDDDDDDGEEEDDEDDSSNRKLPVKQSKDIKTSPVGKKTPVKNAEKSPNKGVDKKLSKDSQNFEISTSPKKIPVKKDSQNFEISTSPKKIPVKEDSEEYNKALKLNSTLRSERDRKSLYMGSLPEDITVPELKALSTDIINVNLRGFNRRQNKKGSEIRRFAFLEFDSEQKAEENYNSLKNMQLRNVNVLVDYAGEKSKMKGDVSSQKRLCLKKLEVSPLPGDSTLVQVAGFFPKAFEITLTNSSSCKSALISYIKEESAAADLEACKSAKLDGKPLSVMYHVVPAQGKRMKKMPRRKQSAKRIKLQKKE